LAGRSEGPQAAAYLEQSVAAYRNALQVRTEPIFPPNWIQTMANLARTYELKKDWSNARQSYEQLLHHDPGNSDWQSKIKELTDKRLK
jgi:tetratricopeptide (TPR) repeat protein